MAVWCKRYALVIIWYQLAGGGVLCALRYNHCVVDPEAAGSRDDLQIKRRVVVYA
jgi:hypothetical protein